MFRLIHDRDVKTITIPGCRLYPDEWDAENQAIVYPENSPARVLALKGIEQLLEAEMERLNAQVSLLEEKGCFTVNDIGCFYRLRKDNGKLTVFVERLAKELDRQGQERTARAYKTASRGLVKFNHDMDVPLAHINKLFIKEFELYMKSEGKLPNTISYYMRNLRAIYNKAVAEKRIPRYLENPFSGVFTGVMRTRKRALNPNELKLIHNIDFTEIARVKSQTVRGTVYVEGLIEAHRYFLFCFHARGMCFIDLAYLRKDNIKGDFLRYVRKKTGQQIEVRITDKMREIIESFSSSVIRSPYVFPILQGESSNIRRRYDNALRIQNNRLKEVALLAGVNKPLTTHWARHSWATVGKLANVPIRVISECLGHNSEATTRIYLGLLDNSVLDAANEVIASAVMHHTSGKSLSPDIQNIQDY